MMKNKLYPNCSEIVARLGCNVNDIRNIKDTLSNLKNLMVGIYSQDKQKRWWFFPIDTKNIKLGKNEYQETRIVFIKEAKSIKELKEKVVDSLKDGYSGDGIPISLAVLKPKVKKGKIKYKDTEIIGSEIFLYDSFGNKGIMVMISDNEDKLYPLIRAIEMNGESYAHDGGHTEDYEEWCNKNEG